MHTKNNSTPLHQKGVCAGQHTCSPLPHCTMSPLVNGIRPLQNTLIFIMRGWHALLFFYGTVGKGVRFCAVELFYKRASHIYI